MLRLVSLRSFSEDRKNRGLVKPREAMKRSYLRRA
jgi:hypothetical protein